MRDYISDGTVVVMLNSREWAAFLLKCCLLVHLVTTAMLPALLSQS
jgi:hypothetical protein